MSNHDDGCATAIATLIVYFGLYCLAAAVTQFVLAEFFAYHAGFWAIVGLLWLLGFILRVIK